jgi:hypothetical protein
LPEDTPLEQVYIQKMMRTSRYAAVIAVLLSLQQICTIHGFSTTGAKLTTIRTQTNQHKPIVHHHASSLMLFPHGSHSIDRNNMRNRSLRRHPNNLLDRRLPGDLMMSEVDAIQANEKKSVFLKVSI